MRTAKAGSVPLPRDVAAELRRAGLHDVDDSPLTRAVYSSDASLYRVVPSVVTHPRDSDELIGVVAVARSLGVPLTMRGAGTSIAGNAVGSGIVVDTRRHLHRIREIDIEARTARVDPGVVHAQLQARLAGTGLRFGPDPSSHTRCTIGGMIGNNACGSRALGYGRTADNVAAIGVLTGTGEQLRLDGRRPRSAVLDTTRRVVDANLATIRTQFGRFSRQASGYALEHLLPEQEFAVARFLAGTEGTLAVILDATVSLVPDAPIRHLLVLGYPSMAEAADAVPMLLRFRPVACEGLDERIIDVFRAAHGGARLPELPRGRAFLYVELTGAEDGLVRESATAVVAEAGALGARLVVDDAEQKALWQVREEGAGLASRTSQPPGLAGWEDASVPPAMLGGYLREFEELLREHGLCGVPYGHFGDGCVHVRIDFPLAEASGRSRFRSFLEDAATLVGRYQGSLSGEHGDGRARSELLSRMYSPEALAVFAQIKRAWDPDDILNPGVLVRPAPVDVDLRPLRSGFAATGLLLSEDAGDLATAVHRCTGVGKCVAAAPSGVMCPSYQATRDERDSTRGRARALQEMVAGEFAGGVDAAEVERALDLCLSCKGCASDCPTGVDIATYKSEVLHQRYRRRLRPRSHYVLGQLPRWARLISRLAPLANRALRLPGVRHGARWLAGVDQRRALPLFDDRRLRPALGTRVRRAGEPTVVLWVDSFTDHFATGPGLAAISLLESAGHRVELVDRRACCGLTWITTGQLTAARRLVSRTIEQLQPWVRRGVPIVGLEPSCLAVLRSDAVELLDDPRAREVAAGTFTLAELLLRTAGWTPPDLTGLEIVVQPHCHHAAVLGFDADMELLAATGASVVRLGGCCGLAGNFGVERGHYEVSAAIAETQLLPAVRNASDGAVFLADGFSCRTQLMDLAGTSGLHLAELLAHRERGIGA